MPPSSTKDVHALIPGAHEYVTLRGKRNFAGVIKYRPWDSDIILDYLGGPNLITWVFKSRDPFSWIREMRGEKKERFNVWGEFNLSLLMMKIEEGAPRWRKVVAYRSRQQPSAYGQQANRGLRSTTAEFCQQPKWAGSGFFPSTSKKRMQPADSLIFSLGRWCIYQTSDFQNHKIMYLCCFTRWSLW